MPSHATLITVAVLGMFVVFLAANNRLATYVAIVI